MNTTKLLELIKLTNDNYEHMDQMHTLVEVLWKLDLQKDKSDTTNYMLAHKVAKTTINAHYNFQLIDNEEFKDPSFHIEHQITLVKSSLNDIPYLQTIRHKDKGIMWVVEKKPEYRYKTEPWKDTFCKDNQTLIPQYTFSEGDMVCLADAYHRGELVFVSASKTNVEKFSGNGKLYYILKTS